MARLEENKKPFKSVQRKIRVIFHRQKWKETLIFLAFVLLSFGFWYLQSLQQDYEIEITLPIRYKDAPAEIAFSDTVPEKVIARIRDKGSVLLNYSFGRKFNPIELNLKDLAIEKGQLTIERKEIEADIYKQLLASTSLIGFEPGSFEIHYSRMKEKKVPVVFNGRVQPSAGFHRSGEVIISPRTVEIYAAETILNSITEVKTVYTEISKVNKTTTRQIKLEKQPGVSFAQETVTLTVPVEEFTEKTVEIPITVTGLPADFTVRLFPPTAKVVCSVPMSRFRDLTEDDFRILLPFSELEQNLTGVTSITLSTQPSWIRSASITPEQIEFILEQDRQAE
ncbi:YbbR-like domain-containing protein [Parabacteroides sp. OttesenSCG-928-J18]|nr:YbbR-like domain-containing protein [Parabacteroides sp. OttesenSCG-928-J18]